MIILKPRSQDNHARTASIVLEKKKIGLVGAGMMAEAIIRGLQKAGVNPSRISASDPDEKRRDFFKQELGIAAVVENSSVVQSADVIILAVKPYTIPETLAEIGSVLKSNQLLISIAAGVTIDSIQSKLSGNIPVIRAMPNTPCLIGEGATAIAPGKYTTSIHMEIASQIFNAIGKVVQISEDKLDAVTGLSGSGPAYVYTFIEALADGGVRVGLPRATAMLLAAQTVAGAAKMVMETDEQPAELRDRVMTPGGTTVAGMASLERSDFRSATIEAVVAATNRSTELGKTNK